MKTPTRPNLLSPRTTLAPHGKIIKKLLITLGVVVVLLAVLVAFAPALASRFGRGIAENALNKDISGSFKIDTMSLSWGGPQQVGPVRLLDPSGAVVAEADLSTGAGLLSLATGGMNLGDITVKLRGDIKQIVSPTGKERTTNLEEALRPRPGVATVPRPGAAQPGQPAPAKELRLPQGLAARLRVTDSEVKYTGELTPGSGVRTIGLTALTASGDLELGKPFTLTATANTLDGQRALDLTATAQNITQADGLVTLDKASADVKLEGAIPAEYLELIAARSGAASAGASSGPGGAGDPPARIAAHVLLKDGRLVLADTARPAFIEVKAPAAALAVPGKDGAPPVLTVAERPTLTWIIESLDVPMPTSSVGGTTPKPVDYRGAKVATLLRSTRMSGSLSTGPNAAARAFTVEPFELRVGTRDFAEGFGALGQINTTLDGKPSGAIRLDLTASDLLDDTGAPRPEGPGRLRGQFLVDDVPTAILQPLAQPAGIDLAEILGPDLKADLRAGLATRNEPLVSAKQIGGSTLAGGGISTDPKPADGAASSAEATSPPYVSGIISSQKTRLWFDLFIDPDRIRARNEGVKLETTALGALARRFTPPDAGITVTGEGLASIIVRDFEFPGVMGPSGLDFGRTRAKLRVIAGELGVALSNSNAGPLTIASLDTEAEIDGVKNPKLSMRHTLEHAGKRFEILSPSLTVAGLFVQDAKAPGGVRLTLKDARPEGAIQIVDMPASVASIAGEQARRLADALFGGTMNLDLTAAPGASGSSTLDLNLTSSGATGAGRIEIGAGRVKTVGEGLTLTLNRPAEVLNAALNPPEGGAAAGVVIDGSAPFTARLSGVDLALGDSSIDPGTIGARISLQGSALGLTLRSPGNTRPPERVEIAALKADAVLDGKGGADLTLDASGAFQNNPFAAKGTLGAGGVLGGGGGESKGIDIRTITPRGVIDFTSVPSSLIALVSPENAVLAQAALGGTFDAQLAALQGDKGYAFTLTSPQVSASSKAVITSDKLTVGPTEARARVTPQTADTILALKAPDLNPRPALRGDAVFVASVSQMNIPIVGPTELGKRPLGAYRAELRNEGDFTLLNATTLGAGTANARPLNVGFRKLGAAAIMNSDPARPNGEITASIEAFDPANPGPTLITARIDGGPNMPTELREATIEATNSAAIDAWLGTPELLSRAVGDTLKLMVLANREPQVGEGVVLNAIVESPRLQTRVTAGHNENGTRILPFSATWTLDPALANQYLFTGADGKPTARLMRPVTTSLQVRALNLGPAGRMLDPAIFKADLGFKAPGLALATPDGVEADMGELIGGFVTLPGGRAQFELSTPGVKLTGLPAGAGTGATAAGATKPLSIKGTLDNIADSTGNLTPELATITSQIVGGLPTPLVDALAGQKGALVDLLGARVDATLDTDRLSKRSGTLAAILRAEYAEASAAGEVRDGVFVSSKQVVARMTRITPEASKRYISTVVPVLSKVEKTADDKPAVITADGLTAPLDGDMSKLNADLVFDLGTVQFQSSDFFGEILKATSNQSFGKVGQKIPPFKAKIRQGVVNYDRFSMPTGEFELATEGQVDLVKRKMRLIVWVPVFALADEISGALRLGNLPGLRDVSSIPLKISGDIDNPKTDVDWERLGKDIIKLPGDAAEGTGEGVDQIIKGIGDLFDKKRKKK
ncbi:MAG: hypothetical protein ACKVZJ_07925 [Phycisphaerales bacterium]